MKDISINSILDSMNGDTAYLTDMWERCIDEKRKRIIKNSNYLRSLLQDKVDIGTSTTWIVPIIYGDERLTLPVSDYLQKEGIDISLMTFPAVSKNRSRIR